jgi:diguanylate cyclase (GGDEF)-like protein
MTTPCYHDQLKIQAFLDLTNRAKPGIFIYVTVWFAISFGFGLDQKNPPFFILNSSVLLALFAIRITHLLVHKRVNENNIHILNFWLVGSILLGALHWGVMSAWVFYDPNIMVIDGPILITLAAFAMGGTATLCISNEIRILYPVLMFAPSITVFLINGDQEGMMYAALITTSLAYIFAASNSVQNDYWKAITNHLVAEERAEAMEKLSVTDPLTKLKNRMYFDVEFEKEWKRSSRLKSSISLLMIDLDYFKQLNDNYGHLFGDHCLKKVAQCIEAEFKRPTDCVARYGGEEFIVMLPNTNEDGAQVLGERIVQKVASLPFEFEGKQIQITCSTGGATTCASQAINRSELVKSADTALYLAKDRGRNRYANEQVED